MDFGKGFSQDIEVESNFNRYVHPWDLYIFTREIIINGQFNNYNKRYFKKWSNFAKAINKLRKLEGEIAKAFINENNVILELFRIAHRQFFWQKGISKQNIFRYYLIFNDPL